MKQLFHIETEGVDELTQQVLSLRIGDKHCSYAITDKSGNQLLKLSYYELEEHDLNLDSALFEKLNLDGSAFYKVRISFDFPESTLVPGPHFNRDDAGFMLKNLYGVNGSSAIISESITEWQVYNVYAVPGRILDWVNKTFATGKYWHQYTISLPKIEAADPAGHLMVDIRQHDCMVLVAAGGKLLLAQTFEYSSPEDVLYYLLKICQEFGLSQLEVRLSLSGLLDKQSVLYKELYQYFMRVEFREASWKDADKEYPSHFFTSLNDLAQCES